MKDSPTGQPSTTVAGRLTWGRPETPAMQVSAMALGWSNREGARSPKVIAELNKVYRDKWGEIIREAGVQPE